MITLSTLYSPIDKYIREYQVESNIEVIKITDIFLCLLHKYITKDNLDRHLKYLDFFTPSVKMVLDLEGVKYKPALMSTELESKLTIDKLKAFSEARLALYDQDLVTSLSKFVEDNFD